ncbi:MAG: hypothetical protein ACOYNO_07735 [Saprospiraceae bacterium]|jgi:hypothetical protein
MPQASLQERLFSAIAARYPKRADAVDNISTVLNISQDAVYRRLRGDTLLSPNEIESLCIHYRLSIDALIFGHSDLVISQYSAISKPVTTYQDYVDNFASDLGQARLLPGAHLYFASVEIPVFSYMFFPELIRFKLYIWGRTTWNLPVSNQHPFAFDLVPEPVLRAANQAAEHYLLLPSTELWSVSICDNTLAQIENNLYSGGFRNRHDALLLCDKLRAWALHMKAMATAGGKFRPGADPESSAADFQLYHNEMVYNNITALLRSDVLRIVYTAFCNPNFLTSTDEKMSDFTERWFHNVLAKSTQISRQSESKRNWFFQELMKKIDRVQKRIELLLEEQS